MIFLQNPQDIGGDLPAKEITDTFSNVIAEEDTEEVARVNSKTVLDGISAETAACISKGIVGTIHTGCVQGSSARTQGFFLIC